MTKDKRVTERLELSKLEAAALESTLASLLQADYEGGQIHAALRRIYHKVRRGRARIKEAGNGREMD